MELDLSSLPTAITSSVCACNLEQLSVLSVSWLKYSIENNSNHVLESGLELCTSSNSVDSFRPNQPRTWFSIIYACRTAKYQNSCPTCFYVMNALAIWIKVCHVRSSNPFEYWRPAGAAIMLELFDIIYRWAFPPINFLSNSEWNWWGRRPESPLSFSSAEVIDMDNSEDIPYSQQYLVSTSTRSRAYWCPHKATQSQKTISVWNFSMYWRRLLVGCSLGGLAMVAKETIFDVRRPDFTTLALVAAVRCFWLRNCLNIIKLIALCVTWVDNWFSTRLANAYTPSPPGNTASYTLVSNNRLVLWSPMSYSSTFHFLCATVGRWYPLGIRTSISICLFPSPGVGASSLSGIGASGPASFIC